MRKNTRVRYAVVGLGYFAQAAVLPAFSRLKNSRLCALVSDDPHKLRKLARRYSVDNLVSYAEYDAFMRSGEVDAVYIVVPNFLHADYSTRASQAGIHVLCEKPLAVTEAECIAMSAAARESSTRLMVGYRLHFESATLTMIDAIRAGKLGEPRLFDASLTMQVRDGNSRLRRSTVGGGPLYDVGIYCINAARSVFQSEPIEVCALHASRDNDARFREAEEQFAAVLRFPGERLASFNCAFGAADVSRLQVIGTKGVARLDPAFEYARGLKLEMQLGGRTSRRSFKKADQIAAEIMYFSNCIQRGKDPEPAGSEGLADVRVIEALLLSAQERRCIELQPVGQRQRPTGALHEFVPPHAMPELVRTSAPSR